MDKIERMERLENLFQWAGGHIAGRKKLHKLIYLSQALGFDMGQEFIFHFYGVYSPSLSKDLEIARSWGLIKEEESGGGYRYSLTDSRVARLDDCEFVEVKRKIAKLKQEPAAVLEVLSTIVFLDESDYTLPQIEKKLEELKKHLRSHFDDAFRLAEENFKINPNGVS